MSVSKMIFTGAGLGGGPEAAGQGRGVVKSVKSVKSVEACAKFERLKSEIRNPSRSGQAEIRRAKVSAHLNLEL